MNIPPGKPLPVLLVNASEQDRQWLQQNRLNLDFLARLESVTLLEPDQKAPESATALVGEMQLLIPMAGLIDQAAELERLDKEIRKIADNVQRIGGKLSNASFVEKAPAAVVDKEREKLAEQQSALSKLEQQREKIRRL